MSSEQQFAIPKPRNSLKDETSDLLAARKEIALFSVKKAAIRVHEQKIHRIMKDPIKQEEEVNEKLRLFGRGYELVASEIADTSAVARGVLSPNEKYLATVGWSGECKIWQGLDSTPTVATRLVGHKFHAYDLDFHPHIASMDPESPCLATGGADCTVKLWTFDVTQPEQNFLEFSGHEDRVNRVKFHPMGLHVFSASYDKTVCMWDIEKEKKLHKFTGHTGGVHSLSMHPDGSLFVSVRLNSGIR